MRSLSLIPSVPHAGRRDEHAPQPRLAPFLALSALMHAVLFAWVSPHTAPIVAAPLQLALVQAPATPAAPARTIPAERRPSRPAPAVTPAPARTALPPPTVSSPTLPRGSDTPHVRTETATAHSDAAILAQVHAALTRHFTYPLMARRQGWQGEVLLGFSVTPEGRIDQVQVVRSCGHRLLDEAARASLARVGNLPDYVPQRESRHLQLPVVYRLAEG